MLSGVWFQCPLPSGSASAATFLLLQRSIGRGPSMAAQPTTDVRPASSPDLAPSTSSAAEQPRDGPRAASKSSKVRSSSLSAPVIAGVAGGIGVVLAAGLALLISALRRGDSSSKDKGAKAGRAGSSAKGEPQSTARQRVAWQLQHGRCSMHAHMGIHAEMRCLQGPSLGSKPPPSVYPWPMAARAWSGGPSRLTTLVRRLYAVCFAASWLEVG